MIVIQQRLEPDGAAKDLSLVANQAGLIMALGDIHFGDRGCAIHRFQAQLHWGMDHGAWFLGMGDWFDFTSESQRRLLAPLRDSAKQALDSMVQERVDELASLIAFTRDHWIGTIVGNHTWGFQDGTIAEQSLAAQLGMPFLGDMTFIRVTPAGRPKGHPEADTIILAHHGYGAGRTPGPRINAVERLIEGFEADIYLMAHDHSSISEAKDRMHVSSKGQLVYGRKKVFARTGGWLHGYEASAPQPNSAPASLSMGGYIEQKALSPAAMTSPVFGIGYELVDETGQYRPLIGYAFV